MTSWKNGCAFPPACRYQTTGQTKSKVLDVANSAAELGEHILDQTKCVGHI